MSPNCPGRVVPGAVQQGEQLPVNEYPHVLVLGVQKIHLSVPANSNTRWLVKFTKEYGAVLEACSAARSSNNNCYVLFEVYAFYAVVHCIRHVKVLVSSALFSGVPHSRREPKVFRCSSSRQALEEAATLTQATKLVCSDVNIIAGTSKSIVIAVVGQSLRTVEQSVA